MRYVSLQYLRAVAVISVLVLHSQDLFAAPLATLPLLSEFGWIGVRLFFVISGFIVAERISRCASLGDYLTRRFMRVFPLYFLVTLIALLLTLATNQPFLTAAKTDSGMPFDPNWPVYVFKSLFLVPQDDWPLFAVGWSLEFEVVFYAIFGIAYFAAGPVTARVVILCLAMAGLTGLTPGSAIAHPFMLYFFTGCLTRDLFHVARRPAIVLALIVIGPSTWAWMNGLYGWSDIGWANFTVASAIAFSALTILFLGAEAHLPRGRVARVIERIGDASFSIYLFHWLVFMVWRLVGHEIAAAPLFLEAARWAILAMTVVASIWVYRTVEGPLNAVAMRWVRRSLPRAGEAPGRRISAEASASERQRYGAGGALSPRS